MVTLILRLGAFPRDACILLLAEAVASPFVTMAKVSGRLGGKKGELGPGSRCLTVQPSGLAWPVLWTIKWT